MSELNPFLSLWEFALAFYTRPAIAETCLQLQDEYQANVCLVIGLHWWDMREQYLEDAAVDELRTHVERWNNEIVLPLRSLRRAIKQPIGKFAQDPLQQELRQMIKHAELFAEKKMLFEIEHWLLQRSTASTGKAAINLDTYLFQLDAPAQLKQILQR